MIATLLLSMTIGVSPDLTNQNKDYWMSQLRNPSQQLRINALQKLSELKFVDSISAMAERLRDEDPQVRFAAIRALALIPRPESLAALNAALPEEQDSYLKSEMKRGKKSLEEILKLETNDTAKEKTAP